MNLLKRIHVERCMERIKKILDGVMPLSLMDVSDQIFVCTILTNVLPPLCS